MFPGQHDRFRLCFIWKFSAWVQTTKNLILFIKYVHGRTEIEYSRTQSKSKLSLGFAILSLIWRTVYQSILKGNCALDYRMKLVIQVCYSKHVWVHFLQFFHHHWLVTIYVATAFKKIYTGVAADFLPSSNKLCVTQGSLSRDRSRDSVMARPVHCLPRSTSHDGSVLVFLAVSPLTAQSTTVIFLATPSSLAPPVVETMPLPHHLTAPPP
jgi:hypothetical protein